jgi:hypothetical protein
MYTLDNCQCILSHVISFEHDTLRKKVEISSDKQTAVCGRTKQNCMFMRSFHKMFSWEVTSCLSDVLFCSLARGLGPGVWDEDQKTG